MPYNVLSEILSLYTTSTTTTTVHCRVTSLMYYDGNVFG